METIKLESDFYMPVTLHIQGGPLGIVLQQQAEQAEHGEQELFLCPKNALALGTALVENFGVWADVNEPPKVRGYYHTKRGDEYVGIVRWNGTMFDCIHAITHYQPIIIPKP